MLRIDKVMRGKHCTNCGVELKKDQKYIMDHVGQRSTNSCINCLLKVVHEFNPELLSDKALATLTSEAV